MAPRLQPHPLHHLARMQIVTTLMDICHEIHTLVQQSNCVTDILKFVSENIRPFWQKSLPTCIKAGILEEIISQSVSSNNHNSHNNLVVPGISPIYLLAILFSGDIKHLRIELCCFYGCSHQTALLTFLAKEGRGLESLELARSSLLRLDRSQVQSIFITASSLKHITFKNIANDNILQTIGTHCTNLISLDISNSKEVTDIGLKKLLFNSDGVRSVSPTNTNINRKCNHSNKIFVRFRHNIYGISRLLQYVFSKSQMKDTTIKELFAALDYNEHPNTLCQTLKYLNVSNTGISSNGILLTIRSVAGLLSIGDYNNIGKILEILDQIMKWKPQSLEDRFRMKNITTSRPSEKCLHRILFYFPELERFCVNEPLFSPKTLSIIPNTIKYLSLHNISTSYDWLSEIKRYLNSDTSDCVKYFALRFVFGESLPSLQLNEYLQNCLHLQTLIIDGASIEWNSQIQIPLMNQLEKIQLGKVVTTRAVRQILKRSPNLKICHVYSCDHVSPDELFNLLNNKSTRSISTYLKIQCFYVHDTLCSLNYATVDEVNHSLPSLKRIGNVKSSALSDNEIETIKQLTSVNNFNIELTSSSHWFSSACFSNNK